MVRDTKGRFLAGLARVRPDLRAAEMARRLIIRRTREGKDRFGRPFAPYKPATLRIKRSKGQPTNPVNLTDSGLMLDRLQARRGRRSSGQTGVLQSSEVVPGTRRDEQIARRHIAGAGRLAVRDFFGLTQQEEALVGATFREQVGRIMREVPGDRRRRIKIQVFG